VSDPIATGTGTVTKAGSGTLTLTGREHLRRAQQAIDGGVVNIRNDAASGHDRRRYDRRQRGSFRTGVGERHAPVGAEGVEPERNGRFERRRAAERQPHEPSPGFDRAFLAAAEIQSDAGTLTLDPATGNAVTGTFALTVDGVARR
jgi:hypothetical protein